MRFFFFFYCELARRNERPIGIKKNQVATPIDDRFCSTDTLSHHVASILIIDVEILEVLCDC